MTAPPVLSDATVTLRGFSDADVPEITTIGGDPEMLRWTRLPADYDEADARRFITYARESWARGTEIVWAMCRTGEDRWAGSVSLRIDRGDPELGDVGFACAPWARGQGLTSAAVRLACAWGFVQRGLARIEWRAQVGNSASLRVAEKVGFRLEGTQRARLSQRGNRRDAWVGGLLPSDLTTVELSVRDMPWTITANGR